MLPSDWEGVFMETGIESVSIPEPIFIRPIREQEEIKTYYGWEDMMREETEESERDDERAPLPYYMGTRVDLLA